MNINNFGVWNETEKKLENRYKEGDFEWKLAKIIIASVEELQAEDISAEDIFSRVRTKVVSNYRGYLMLKVSHLLEEILKHSSSKKVSIPRVASDIFHRDRGTLLYYKEMEGNPHSAFFEISESDTSTRIDDHFEILSPKTDKTKNRRERTYTRAEVLQRVGNCSLCRGKF